MRVVVQLPVLLRVRVLLVHRVLHAQVPVVLVLHVVHLMAHAQVVLVVLPVLLVLVVLLPVLVVVHLVRVLVVQRHARRASSIPHVVHVFLHLALAPRPGGRGRYGGHGQKCAGGLGALLLHGRNHAAVDVAQALVALGELAHDLLKAATKCRAGQVEKWQR